MLICESNPSQNALLDVNKSITCQIICNFDTVVYLVRSTDLFLMNLECVSILHVQSIWAISGLNATAVKEKPHGIRRLSLSLTERVHELLERCRTLDLEEDLVVIVSHLDVQMLRCWGIFWLLRARGVIVF